MDERINYGKVAPEGIRALSGLEAYVRSSGFEPGLTRYGTGLQGMADRLDAVRGSLEVRSAPGRGTTVVGRLPVPVSDPVPSTTVRT